MITVIFPHKTYSENKLKIKAIIKKYGMSWDDKKSGWVNEATGDGVYIDKSVMEMIMGDTFSEEQPMTLFVESKDQDFLREFEAKCSTLGGQIIQGGATPVLSAPKAAALAGKKPEVFRARKDIFEKLGMRDAAGCNAPALQQKAYEDLKDISARWERRKKQLLVEYHQMGLDEGAIGPLLHREEIAFRKNNACWVTGKFLPDGGDVTG